MSTTTPEKRHTPAHYPGVCDSILDTVGHTPLVRLKRLFADTPDVTVLGKVEFMNPNGSMKDRIALNMIETAEKEGRIKPGDTLVEPTSGNTGLGLAMVCAAKGYKLIITMPLKMSEEKRRLLRAFGAELILTPTELAFDHPDGYIELAKRIAREQPNTHMLNQYDNPNNPAAHYASTGPEIWEQTGGNLDYLILGMGTGGTISGTGKYLKEKKADITIIGTDPIGSIYSGGEPGQYLVEGIGYDFWPKVFNREVVDVMERVSDKDAFAAVRRLAKEEGILAGGSTGTVIAGLQQYLTKHAAEMKGKTVVMMIHDSGRSYISKIYNDDWMAEQGLL